MALIDKIKAIANGFRASRGTEQEYSLDEMAVLAAEKVGGGGPLQAKTAYPSHSEQVIAPDEGYYGLVSVTVKPVPRLPFAAVSVESGEIPFDYTGVTCYFDCREGVTETSWKNQRGDDDIELYNPIITSDYVEVVGSETSYGKLTHGGETGTAVTTQDYQTRYYVFKNLSGSYANWKTIIGNEASRYCCSTIAMTASGGLQFTRSDLAFTSYSCADWHVIAIRSTKGGTTDIWVDGVSVGSASNCQGWAADTFLARGTDWWYDDNNTAFRAIVIADVKHTDSQIVYNSGWLKTNFIDKYTA